MPNVTSLRHHRAIGLLIIIVIIEFKIVYFPCPAHLLYLCLKTVSHLPNPEGASSDGE
jgi:hypothetical protein